MSRPPLRKRSKTAQPVTWNAADYAANSVLQQTWARELIARLKLRGDEHILDVGCGDGKVTAEIARAVPRGFVVGIDASAEMIGFARKAFPPSQISNLKFQICDARKIGSVGRVTPCVPQFNVNGGQRTARPTFAVRQFDLVFSNAALHWVDDHPAFLRGAASVLKSGGRLVVSCGGKGNAQDVFVALRPEMRLKRWREFFRRMPTPYFFYAPAITKNGCRNSASKFTNSSSRQRTRLMTVADGFAAWLRTTWLPYTQRVPENLREEFIAAVTDALRCQTSAG